MTGGRPLSDDQFRRQEIVDSLRMPSTLEAESDSIPSKTTVTIPRILDPADPLGTARRLAAECFSRDGYSLLHYHRGDFFKWRSTAYVLLPLSELRAIVYKFCEGSRMESDKGNFYKPNSRRVSDIIDALRSAVQLSESIEAPAWLDEVTDLQPSDILPCVNGLLFLPEMRVLGLDPAYFNISSLPVAYDPDAPDPTEWLRFLDSLWGDDREAIACLQEIFGYLLTTETRQQKIFSLVGPRRSGKGTIARVLTALLGAENVVNPTLTSLGKQFGLEPLIHKPLAIIADARLGSGMDTTGVLESLLNISGEDSRTIDRKHRRQWTGKLPTRFLLLSNELPRILDTSAALAGRFVLLTLRQSFYGREDTELTDRLMWNLRGILKWSLDGHQRLRERGRFILPQSSQDAAQELEDLGSPVGAFVRDRCERGAAFEVGVKQMYAAWCSWCTDQGRDHPGTMSVFGRNLRAVLPGIKTRGRRPDNKYEGIRLK